MLAYFIALQIANMRFTAFILIKFLIEMIKFRCINQRFLSFSFDFYGIHVFADIYRRCYCIF